MNAMFFLERFQLNVADVFVVVVIFIVIAVIQEGFVIITVGGHTPLHLTNRRNYDDRN